jgi:hypothetical protein
MELNKLFHFPPIYNTMLSLSLQGMCALGSRQNSNLKKFKKWTFIDQNYLWPLFYQSVLSLQIAVMPSRLYFK